MKSLYEEARTLQDQIVADRRYLHQIPEVGMDLPESAAYIEKRLSEMGIASHRDADASMQKIRSGVSAPLKNITGGYHYHTVTAESEAALDAIEAELRARGFFVAREE